MTTFDPKNLKFSPRREAPSVFRDYLEQVANQELLAHKSISQHGGKRGESLYTHILNGIMLLEALRQPLALSDLEMRLLFTVFTIHDINKERDFSGQNYGRIALPDNFNQQIVKLGLDVFFPEYSDYLDDITNIARRHSGHSGMLDGISGNGRLDYDRIEKLLSLIRAIDIVDLSHTLEERSHKATFLSHLNDFLDDRQYAFYIHRLAENRGSLSNLIHNALVATLRQHGLIPLLYYPDGVAYLMERGQSLVVDERLRRSMAKKVTASLNEMTSQEYESFIKSGIQGIKVDPKCLELGLTFENIWNTIHRRVQSRNLKRDELLGKVVERTERNYEKNAITYPQTAAAVRELLDDPESLLPASTERLRDGELIRSYYIFLRTHFKELANPWQHICDLLELPASARPVLDYFDALWDRPYVLMRELTLTHESIFERIEADGTELMADNETADDKVDLFDEYLARYALFGPPGAVKPPANDRFADHLVQYTANQHKQCVHCSTLFTTDRWMTNDVRSDITVQTFSNRLRGGPGEPKKFVCRLCHLQFLVERLNYEEVRGEKTMYLHFFPYSFLPAPLLDAMREGIDSIRGTDAAVRALWLRADQALLAANERIDPTFAIETNAGKPHPYGMYLPRNRNTIGNRLIFPINPAGSNDSGRFLFALWNLMVLQRHFGLRAMLSESPVAPFVPDVDLYIDNVALSCQGLIGRNDYAEFADYATAVPGPLQGLWQQARSLHQIVRQVRTTSNRDEMLALVQSMANGPLHIFYTTEKLLEARVRGDQKASSPEWLEIRLAQQIFSDLELLALSKGGTSMTELSRHLQTLAQTAWQGGLRGKSLKKNSLMTPLDEVFKKLNMRSQAFDEAAIKAAIAEDIFEYLERIADEQYAPGRRKMTKATEFVETFFNCVYQECYQGNLTRLLSDEKLLRSAFMFYMRQQIPTKQAEPTEAEA
jgi:CRISPR-associated protein Csc3